MSAKQNKVREALKNIPSVDEIINKFQPTNTPLKFLKCSINIELSNIRSKILAGQNINDIKKYTFNKINKIFNKIKNNSLQPVINGTGIILHTGLGRAPISKEILYESIDNTFPYTNLEFDLKTGKRGDRNIHIADLFNSLCNAESSLIVPSTWKVCPCSATQCHVVPREDAIRTVSAA